MPIHINSWLLYKFDFLTLGYLEDMAQDRRQYQNKIKVLDFRELALSLLFGAHSWYAGNTYIWKETFDAYRRMLRCGTFLLLYCTYVYIVFVI